MRPIQQLDSIDRTALANRGQTVDADVRARATEIVADVRTNGDAALRQWTSKLDGVDLEHPFIDEAAWLSGAAECPDDVKMAIDGNMARIQAFHKRQQGSGDSFEVVPGVTLGRRPVPFGVAACYVPGGRASYPSTVLMTVIPARIAGVEQIMVVTPPRPDGTVDPAVLYAARTAGATAVLAAGGAQAIAAVAYGTGLVPKADCIVGPGNAYVTAAKQIVQDMVRIDSPAGPSELLILADESANPSWIAADMVAQAEHDPDAQCITVCTTQQLAESVAAELQLRAPDAKRSQIVQQSLTGNGMLLVGSVDDAIDFANEYAAEHLEIQTANAEEVARRIRNAGSIFIGGHAPVPIGDYGSGTNHVLPTMGFARTHSGLNVDDFRKWITWQSATPDGLRSIAPDVIALARAEGLDAHADAVEERL